VFKLLPVGGKPSLAVRRRTDAGRRSGQEKYKYQKQQRSSPHGMALSEMSLDKPLGNSHARVDIPFNTCNLRVNLDAAKRSGKQIASNSQAITLK
jgi:hypothetical protein